MLLAATPTPIQGTTETVKDALKDITVSQKLLDGTEVLTIYYVIIIIFFLMDIIVLYRWNVNSKRRRKKPGPVRKGLINLYRSYRKHGLVTLNTIIWMVCIAIIFWNIGFEFRLMLAVTISIIIFTLFMKIIIRIFINKDSYEDEATIRAINLICYILLGNIFCYYMTFISAPDLLLSYAGLTFALTLCYYIMLHAIFNPEILQKSATSYMLYSEAFGIIKGMLAVLICMLGTLFLMLYACYKTDPAFFVIENGEVLDVWDILYFLVISFTTIGFGDIVPFRLDGMFYSYFAAILIGISSLFTTTCFVAAIISTANSIAKSTRERFREYIDNPHPIVKNQESKASKPEPVKEDSEDDKTDKFKQILHEVLNEYNFEKKSEPFISSVNQEVRSNGLINPEPTDSEKSK